MFTRFAVAALLSVPCALAPAQAEPRAQAFDRLFEQVDDSQVPVDTSAQVRAALAGLRARVPPGDAVRELLYRSMVCALAFEEDAAGGLRYAAANLPWASRVGDLGTQARLQYCRGLMLEQLNDAGALAAYEAGLKLAQRAEDPRLIGDGYVLRGGNYSMRGRQALALSDFLQGQAIFERARLDRRAESNLISIGTAYRRLGVADDALRYLRQAEDYARRLGHVGDRVGALSQQGYVFQERGQPAEAVAVFTRALELAHPLGRISTGYSRLALADAYVGAGNAPRAQALLAQAREDLAVGGTAANEPMLDEATARALALSGRHREALAFYARAEPLMIAQRNERYLALLRRARSASYEALGDWPHAMQDLHSYDALSARLRADAEDQRVTLWRIQFDASRRELDRRRLQLDRAQRDLQIRSLERERPWRWATLALGVGLAGLLAWFAVAQRRDARVVRALALSDPLTGIANRRRILLLGERAAAVAEQRSQPLCALVLDLDHFKQVNDAYGHATGDAVLTEVARALSATMRRDDHLGRTGGEEFLVILPATVLEDAVAMAERLREAVAAIDLSAMQPGLRVHASVGVARWRPGDPGLQALIQRADAALFEAKKGGRNRVMVGD